MRLRTGTSGFAYKEWKGSFYPEDLAASAMLHYYSGRLGTVEINNTFYRMPTEKLLAGWAADVGPEFSFVLKAPRRITHLKRLRGAEEDTDYLLRTASVLGQRLGPILFQLPPNMKKDIERLREFLATLPSSLAAAFEFRNPTWFDDEVYDALRERGAALVASDMDDAEEPPVVATGTFGYLRLRRAGYDDDALSRWAERVAAQPWQAVWVFFKHEDAGAGPALALRFAELARERIPS